MPEPMLQSMGLVQRECEIEGNWVEDILVYPQYYSLTELDRTFIENLQKVREKMGSGTDG